MSTIQNQSDTVKRIMVVDDNMMSRKVVLYRIEQLGYAAASVSSGIEALKMCTYQKPDLIFLDLMMNGMSGLEVLQVLKVSSDFHDIPIVMISGVEETDAIDECLEAGASDFLHKPVQEETLKSVIEDLIGNPHINGGAEDYISPTDVADFPVLAEKYIAQLMQDYGEDATQGFVQKFNSHAPELCQILQDSSDKFEACRKAANALKGGARTLGLLRLAAACRVVEQSCIHGDPYETKSVTRGMHAYLNDALQALQSHVSEL